MGEIAEALKRADQSVSTKKKESPPKVDSRRDQPPSHPRSSSDLRGPDPVEPLAEVPEPAAPEDERRLLALKREGDDLWRPARITISEPFAEATQQFKRLAFRLRDLADSRGAQSIVVTSAESGDGKTTTSCNLAIQLARLDQALRVVLVDLDLRRASIAMVLGLEGGISVDSVLRGEHSLDDAIYETDVPGLSIVPLTHTATEPESLLARSTLRSMIADLEQRFDFVIIDTPPVLAVSDAQVILRHASAALFVARAGRTYVKAIRRAIEHLPTGKLLGSFMNSDPGSDGLSGYPYYGYGVGPTADDGSETVGSPSESADSSSVH